MKIYVIRHGQTNWNIEGRIQGKTDIELNNEGNKQALKIKSIIKDYNIDLIISSPLKRARKTAEIINEALNCPIIFDKSLEERGYGIFEGKVRRLIKDNIINSNLLNNYNINLKYKGIEPIYDLCERVWNLLDNIKRQYNDKNILLVSHGGTIRAINGYFEGMDSDGLIRNPNLSNCQIKIYEMEQKNDI